MKREKHFTRVLIGQRSKSKRSLVTRESAFQGIIGWQTGALRGFLIIGTFAAWKRFTRKTWRKSNCGSRLFVRNWREMNFDGKKPWLPAHRNRINPAGVLKHKPPGAGEIGGRMRTNTINDNPRRIGNKEMERLVKSLGLDTVILQIK